MTATQAPLPAEASPARQEKAQNGGMKQFISFKIGEEGYAIDIKQLATVTGTPLAGSYLQLVENQPGGLGVIPLHGERDQEYQVGLQIPLRGWSLELARRWRAKTGVRRCRPTRPPSPWRGRRTRPRTTST